MRVSFKGNHLYRFCNQDTATDFCRHYHEYRMKNREDMIVYGFDNYVHVIDGKEKKDFTTALKMNNEIIREPFSFEALTRAYQKIATHVDFSNIYAE